MLCISFKYLLHKGNQQDRDVNNADNYQLPFYHFFHAKGHFRTHLYF